MTTIVAIKKRTLEDLLKSINTIIKCQLFVYICVCITGCLHPNKNEISEDKSLFLKNKGYTLYDCHQGFMKYDYFNTSPMGLLDSYRLDSCAIYINTVDSSKIIVASKKEGDILFKDIIAGDYWHRLSQHSMYNSLFITNNTFFTKKDSFFVFSSVHKCRFCSDKNRMVFKKHCIGKNTTTNHMELCYIRYFNGTDYIDEIEQKATVIMNQLMISQ
ncbi:MAG: hypothetical protein JNM36_18880 [Chitinophagales bacterium]|nr:hypothetical protein [Chitinophagales bacterium]